MLFQDSEPFDTLGSMTPHTPSPLTQDQAALLRRTITKNLSEDEHALFVQTCERSGLDPFARHIYPIKREQWNPETRRKEWQYAAEATIDGLRLTAERTGKYGGQLGPEWCGKDGVWRDIWTEDTPPVGARVGIIRTDFKEPVWGKALYSEFVQTYSNGQPTPFWDKMAANQLAKCAEALGFRKAFPREFSGIYTRDEMQQAEVLEAEKASQAVLPPVEASASNSGSSVVFPPSTKGDSDHGAGVETRPVPVQLRVFVNRGTGERKNIGAAFKFLQDELIFAAGPAGQQVFDRITLVLPRTFRTKEECHDATINCWLDLWEQVEKARKAREVAA